MRMTSPKGPYSLFVTIDARRSSTNRFSYVFALYAHDRELQFPRFTVSLYYEVVLKTDTFG
jgi:hypothetical protein